ncbi:MAG: ABC transporter substrate-binding protein [Alphaproteobacteria bacterium]|nr:ABC transporter substrate-binding protein [Alphaproteobacteria bacterium]
MEGFPRVRELALAVAIAGWAAAAAPTAVAQTTQVTFAQSIDGFLYGPLYVARAGGYLEREGIKPEMVISGGGSKAMTAMVAGSADIYVGAPFELINVANQGRKVVAFATLMERRPSQIIIRKEVADRIGVTATSPLDQRMRALKGMKLGVSSAKSSGDGLMRYFLRRAGFNPDRDAEIVPVGGAAAAVAAFATGKVDIMSFTSPVIEQALVRGPGIILIDLVSGEIPEYLGYPFICLIAREDWLDANPKAVSGVIRALAQAQAFMRENKDAARGMLRPFFPKLEEELFLASYETNWPGYARSPVVVPKNFEVAFREFDVASDQPAKVTPEQIATNRYVAAALK